MAHVRCFKVGYELTNDRAWYNELNATDRENLRVYFGAYMHERFTHKSMFKSFAAHPDHVALRNHINAEILGPEGGSNPEGVVIPEDVTKNLHNQEHVWVNGVWVCESRFTLYDGDDPYEKTQTVSKASGDYLFTARYYISAFNNHMTP